jgi:hypothetical protein
VVVEVVGSGLVLEQRSEVSDGRRGSRFWHGFIGRRGSDQLESAPNMTFVAGSLRSAEGAGVEGEGKGKGREETDQCSGIHER